MPAMSHAHSRSIIQNNLHNEVSVSAYTISAIARQ